MGERISSKVNSCPIFIYFFLDENENEKPAAENVVKRDYSENRNLYRDDEQVSLCVERYEERLV